MGRCPRLTRAEGSEATATMGPMTPASRIAATPPHMNGEGWLFRFIAYRDSWMTSLIFSSVFVRLAVQPSSSYLMSLTADIGGMLPGSLLRSTSERVGRLKVAFRIISRVALALMKSTNALADSVFGPPLMM